jgi:phage major head subunit gpT-like protein
MISPTGFKVFITAANAMIGTAYTSTPILAPEFMTEVPTDTEVYTDAWTGMLDKMRPWVGSRTVTEPAVQVYSVSVLPFQQTIALDRFDLDDDKFDVHFRDLQDMARQAKRWQDYEGRSFLEGAYPWAGTPQLGLDGGTHWSTAHPVDRYDSTKGTYCNDFTGGGQSIGGITVGGAFSPTAFKTLWEYNSTLRAEDNEPMHIVPNLLMYPAALHGEVQMVLTSASFAPPAWGTLTNQVGAAENIFRRYGVTPLMNPLLTSRVNWYLFDTTKGIMPLRWILRQSPLFVQRLSEDDPVVFDDHKYVWGDWGRACCAWSFAWLSARSGP